MSHVFDVYIQSKLIFFWKWIQGMRKVIQNRITSTCNIYSANGVHITSYASNSTTLVKADVCNQPLNVFGQFPWSERRQNTSANYKCLILAYGRHSLLRYTSMWIEIKLFHMQHNILTKTSHSILKYELEFLVPVVCHKNTVDFNCTGWRLALRTPCFLTLYTMDITTVVQNNV